MGSMHDPIPPEPFLAGFPDEIRRAAERLRSILRATFPDVIERVRPGWHLIGYEIGAGRRTRYFAYVAPESEHVHLGFEHGVAMDDPGGHLLGAGITKQTRWLTFRSPDEIEDSTVVPLIREAALVASLPASERLARRLDREDRPEPLD